MKEMNLMKILSARVVVNITRIYEHDCIELMTALKIGGASIFAITVENATDYPLVLNALKAAREHFRSEVLIGINNVPSVDVVQELAEAGAQFIMSLNSKKEMIHAAHDAGLVAISGVMTPNEIIAAHESGADIVHVYPAQWLGPAYFNYACKLLNHIPIMTSGGIDHNNMRLYMHAGVDVVVADECLYSKAQVEKREWYTISDTTRKFMDTIVHRK